MPEPANILDLLDELMHLPQLDRDQRLAGLDLSDGDRTRLLEWLRTADEGSSSGSSVVGFLEKPPAMVRRALDLMSGSASGAIDGLDIDTSTALAQSIEAIAPPPLIPGYDILEPLGHGGMSTVWLAHQRSTGRKLALKLVAPWLFASRQHRARFEREVRLASRLEHPHIARVYDGGSAASGVCFYAMEWIEGLHLDQYIKKHGLDTPAILRLMREVCLAVQHAHQKGIIHRDLKPSNILIDRDGHPHVLDFGLARALDEAASDRITLTQEGQLAGTLAFMSPEQASGRSELLDVRTDVYGLGATLYLLLTGRSAHDTTGPRDQALRRIAEQEPRRPRQLRKDLDGELESLILRALAHEVESRYPSAGEFAADIDRYLQGQPLSAKPPKAFYILRKWLWRHRAPVAAAVLTTATAIGGVAFSYRKIRLSQNAAITAMNEAIAARTAEAAQRRFAELAKVSLLGGDPVKHWARWVEREPDDIGNWFYLTRAQLLDADSIDEYRATRAAAMKRFGKLTDRRAAWVRFEICAHVLGRSDCTRQDYDQAVESLEVAYHLAPNDLMFLCHRAYLKLLGRDKQAYHDQCHELLTRFRLASDPEIAELMVQICLYVPDNVDARDLPALEALAALAWPADTTEVVTHRIYRHRLNQSVYRYRCGRYAEAAAELQHLLQRAVTTEPEDRMLTYLFLALTEHRLGRVEEAGRCFEKGAQPMEEPRCLDRATHLDRLFCPLARDEARTQLKLQ
jgi:hypothetical protein